MAEEPESPETDVRGTDSPDAEDPGSGHRPKRRGTAAIAVVVLLVLSGGIFALTRGNEPAPTTTTTTTSTVRRPTTTTVEKLPVGTFEIATVRAGIPQVQVLAEAPAEWDSTAAVRIAPSTTTPPPLSQASAPKRAPIPSEKDSVVGRYAVDNGWEFTNPGPFEPPQPLTFLVVERRGNWLQVLLPVRPNGTLGYLKNENIDLTTTQQRVEVHLSEHKLMAYDGDQAIVESPIVVGIGFSPTPTGVFYLTDTIPNENPAGFYGPYILATNGYSEVLDEFDDGAPVVAIHGTNRPELMGQDMSNGCIRVPNDVISKLAETLVPGVPILIWP